MKWRFWEREKLEERQQQPYTDEIIRALANQAAGNDQAINARTGTEEAIAGLWSRSFAIATVSPDTAATRALTPATLALIGRELFDRGQAVFEIVVSGGAVSLVPASSWTIEGTDRWTYRLTIAQPSAVLTRWRDQDAVVHLVYATDVEQPWLASGPVERAATTRQLAAALELRMSQEANGPVGNLLPVPAVEGTSGLQADIKALKGGSVLVPSTQGDWDNEGAGGRGSSPQADWQPRRLGVSWPATLEPTRQGVSDHLAAAGGVVGALLRGDSEGTALREAQRQFVNATIKPVAKIIQEELRVKLDTPDLALSFDSLFASDLAGRTRSFQAMVKGGMDVDKAAMLAGLMEGAE